MDQVFHPFVKEYRGVRYRLDSRLVNDCLRIKIEATNNIYSPSSILFQLVLSFIYKEKVREQTNIIEVTLTNIKTNIKDFEEDLQNVLEVPVIVF